MAAAIGALRVTLGANTAQFDQGMTRAQATARRTGQSIERSMSGMSIRTSQAFGRIRVAAAGMGVALGAIAFVGYGRNALQMAAGLSETARQIGVTVEQLQVLRLAATQNGASIEGMERAVAILNRTLGQARAGVPAAVAAFRALRIDPNQFSSAGEAIGTVFDRISSLNSAAERAAIGQRLLGRGFAEMAVVVQQGSAGLNTYRQQLIASGMLTQEQADKADEAMDALGRLATVIQNQLAAALVEILPAISAIIQGLGAIAMVAIAAVRGIQWLVTEASGLGGIDRIISNYAAAHGGRLAAGSSLVVGPRAAAGGGPELDLSGGGGGSNRANQQREKALRDAHGHQTALRRLRIEELRATQEQAQDAVGRLEIGNQISELEREQARSDLDLSLALKDIDATKHRELLAARAILENTERQGETLAHTRQVAEDESDLADARYEAAADALRSESSMATTAAERQRAELELLDLTYRHQRAKLDAIINDTNVGRDQHAIDRALIERAALDRGYGRDQASTIRQNQGPLGNFLMEIPNTAARANEALQRVAADGLSSITDGLVDAIMLTRSWGDVFKNVARQIIADLLRIAIQRSITGPLGNALSGLLGGGKEAGKGAGMDAWNSFFKLGIPPRAAGGPVLPGRTYLIGEKGPELLHMGGAGHVVANDNIGGGGIVINQTFAPNFAGNAATKEDMVRFAGIVKQDTINTVRDLNRRRG